MGGASANARQIREIADWDMPVAAAIDLADQCAAAGPKQDFIQGNLGNS